MCSSPSLTTSNGRPRESPTSLIMQEQAPINLMRGWPSTSLLPVDLIKDAAQAALSDPNIACDGLLYGPDPGYEPAREAISAWLTQFYQPSEAIRAERTCITGGASQSLGCVLSVYSDPEYTRNIWIVAPSYYLAFGILEDAGFAAKMRAVPEDGEGLDLAFLAREIQKSEEAAVSSKNDRPQCKPARARAKVYKHIIYCVPTFANPSSRTMTLDRREGLVRLARRYDALLVADDVYDFLQWPADADDAKGSHLPHTAHLPRLVDIDRQIDGGAERERADGFGNACSNGSFSKIAGPGIRCGWVEGTKKFAYGVSQTYVTLSFPSIILSSTDAVSRCFVVQACLKHMSSLFCTTLSPKMLLTQNLLVARLAPAERLPSSRQRMSLTSSRPASFNTISRQSFSQPTPPDTRRS